MCNRRKRATSPLVWVRSGKCVKHDFVSSTSGSLEKLGLCPADLRQFDAIFAPITSSFPQFLRETLPPQRFLQKSPPTVLPPLRKQLPPLPPLRYDDDEIGERIHLGFFGTVRCPQSMGNSRQGSVKVVFPASWQAERSSAKARWSKEFFLSPLSPRTRKQPYFHVKLFTAKVRLMTKFFLVTKMFHGKNSF